MRIFDKRGLGAEDDLRLPLSRRRALLLLGGVALLAGCGPTATTGLPGQATLPPPELPRPTGGLGTGSVKIGLLLPLTAPGAAGALASSMKNALELGLNDFPGNDLSISVKDTLNTAEGAAAAAQAVIAEGVELIIGPIFAAEVRGVAPVASAANIPVFAFSSDPSVAAPGIYILGFMVDDQVRQMMAQASSAGNRSMAAIISDGGYGTLAEAALRQTAPRYGIRLVQVQRYAAGAEAQAVQQVLSIRGQIDSLFVPDGPPAAASIASALTAGGLSFAQTRLIGSGQWNDPSVYSNPALTGGWFPAPDIAGFQGFAGRYRSAFGSEPPLTATLAYDAVVLAAGLVRAAGQQRFQRSVISNPEGFLSSVNGLFRFNADGTNDRGLAVYEIAGASPRLVQTAPRAFTGF